MRKISILCCGLALLAASWSLRGDELVADSVSEFSGVQGADGWFYGQYDGWYPGGFSELAHFDSGSQQWSGSQTFATPSLQADRGHPGMDDLAWAVRRWISEVEGDIEITGQYSDLDTSCGDGSHVRILLQGIQIFGVLNVPPGSGAFSVTASVSLGDRVDFAIDPGFDPACDQTGFYGTIVKLDSDPPGEIFVDDFESGNLSAWSAAVP